MSESAYDERHRFEEIIDALKKRRPPKKVELISCGQKAKTIHQKITKIICENIQNRRTFTCKVVKGGFGSGKTHLIHWILNELWYQLGDDVLISVVDVNRVDTFPDLLKQILLETKNKQNQSLSDLVIKTGKKLTDGITLSKFERFKDKVSEGDTLKEKICNELITQGFDDEGANKLATFLAGKNFSETELATYFGRDIRFFKEFYNLFLFMQYSGLCIFLDEFESLDVNENKVRILDMFRCLHDDGGDLKSTFMLVLTREVFWEQVKKICLPLHQRWNDTQDFSLGELSLTDIEELFSKLLWVYEKADFKIKPKKPDGMQREITGIHEGLTKLGLPLTFREIITIVIEKIEGNWIIK